jgi:hypothetical protein
VAGLSSEVLRAAALPPSSLTYPAMVGTLAILPDLKRLVMESVRVTSSIVGTKAADEPKVRFWKDLREHAVSDIF